MNARKYGISLRVKMKNDQLSNLSNWKEEA